MDTITNVIALGLSYIRRAIELLNKGIDIFTSILEFGEDFLKKIGKDE